MATTERIGAQVIALVRAKAAADPEFVYKYPVEKPMLSGGIGKSCMYVHNGFPSCLIGQALWDAGHIGATLENTEMNNDGVSDLLHKLGIYHEFSRDELAWLVQAQEQQDKGMPWGEAVAYADFHSSFNTGGVVA